MEEEITSASLIEELKIISENILNEAARQPGLFVLAARYRVAAMRRKSQAKAELEYQSSHLSLTIRKKRKALGDKPTEKYIENRVKTNKDIRALNDAYHKADQHEEFSILLLEAFRMRRDAIRIIAEGQRAEGLREVGEIERADQNRKLRKTALELEKKRSKSA